MSGEAKPALIFHPDLQTQHPQMVNAIYAAANGDNPQVLYVHPDVYTDQTPHMTIPFPPEGISRAVVPGFISGYNAESQLDGLVKIGHTLRFRNPIDPRSPRAEQVMMHLSDLEGRGTKPTKDASGKYISDAELHYAYLIADQLRDVGKVSSVSILDPHDLVSVEAIRRPYLTLTALQEVATTLKQEGMIPRDSGVVIADDGAIGRSHFFAEAADIPVVGRIEKSRKGGVAHVEHIHTINPNGFSNRTIFLVDDMIATGGTLFNDAGKVKDMGARSVIGVVTHVKGVQGADIKVRDELHRHAGLDGLVITNSTPYYHQLLGIPGVKLVDVLNVLGKAAMAYMSPDFELTNAHVRGVESISGHIYHMASIEESKERLARSYPALVPEMKRRQHILSGALKYFSTVFRNRGPQLPN
ncbi:MAG: hypothetical protein WCO78_02875 [Candidatus Roizmanbacteria bacterium]